MSTFSLMVSATIVAMLLTVAAEIAERPGARRRALPARAVWIIASLLCVTVFVSWAISNSESQHDRISLIEDGIRDIAGFSASGQ